ncbi:MAG: hypothetical protein JEZ11_02740 [Desulfobacterales bacterium]|nr:hypothetical protein [Desulfobacterales bacterium]
MIFKLTDIEDAYLFANADPDFGSQAILCRDAGEIYYVSEFSGLNEAPEDVFDNDACIAGGSGVGPRKML